MRRFPVCVLITFVASLAMGGGRASALSESDIQGELSAIEALVAGDLTAAMGFTCGGLLASGDARALSYYARLKKLNCAIDQWCSAFSETTGDCIGKLCTIERIPAFTPAGATAGEPGRVTETWLSDCTAGSCVPVQPRTACAPQWGGFGVPESPVVPSRLRYYVCDGGVRADCYSFLPDSPSEEIIEPLSHNCVLTYPPAASSPVGTSEPTGRLSLVVPFDIPPPMRNGAGVFDPTAGSNISVASGSDESFPRDSSMEMLAPGDARLRNTDRVRHPVASGPLLRQDRPDLSRVIGQLAQPPEVRLVLPKGGAGLAHDGSPLFSRIFNEADAPEDSGPVVSALGSEPDALLAAARYLRSIPLLEVRYKPVTVLVPSASEAEIMQIVSEWRTWLKDLQAQTGVDPDIVDAVDDTVAALQSYVGLRDAVIAFSRAFPEYLDALLGYVEDFNRFFREEWVKENAQRLEDWHDAYRTYLPDLTAKLRALYDQAADFTAACLVPACRLDAVPVKAGTNPMELMGPGSTFVLGGADRAWYPGGFPLWERKGEGGQPVMIGEAVQFHPLEALGLPLPDITLDLSELFLPDPIVIPVPQVEMVELSLPRPPAIAGGDIAGSVAALRGRIRPLPRFQSPSEFPVFPVLSLPDPETSLFVVPPPPKALPTWIAALKWRKDRLADLQSVCDPSGAPKTFLVSELALWGSSPGPAAVRSAALVPSPASIKEFKAPSPSWPPIRFPSPPPGTVGVALDVAPACPGPVLSGVEACPTARPQRFIRQHMELDLAWERFQDRMLTAVDEWNAQVKFFSVVPRDELVTEERDYRRHSGLFKFLE